ncbi:DUF4302 domain-containing protein [Capnocytophaga canimorsus]|uniref:DUF4302 domain-containing protein n=1 Tax=Capnocytophaga canimorsus TaxID=28188 RepID=UPI0037D742BC
MKKIKQLIGVLVALLTLGGCQQDKESVFEKPANQRVSEAIQEYRQILKSAEHGWGFEYYTKGNERSNGGYNFQVSFTDTDVTASLLGFTGQKTSNYDIIPNGGPTLTFDQYNDVLHYFTVPDQDRYQADLAEYEFLILSYESNVVTLKGKKYGSLARLVKLQNANYLQEVDVVRKYVKNGFKSLTIEGKTTEFSTPTRYNVAFKDVQTGKELKEAFVLTPEGIRFYETVKINGVTFQEMVLNTSEGTLVSKDGKVVFVLEPPIPLNFDEVVWKSNKNNNSDSFKQLWETARSAHALHPRYGHLNLFPNVDFGKMEIDGADRMAIILYIRGIPVAKQVYFKATNTPNEVNIELGSGGYNFIFPYFLTFVQGIVDKAPYTIEHISNAEIKLISKSDADFWIILNK